MNAEELFSVLESIEGSRDAGEVAGTVDRSRLVNGTEFALASTDDEKKLRSAWKRRQGGGPAPLVLIGASENGGGLKVLGPLPDGPLRTIRADSLADLIKRAAEMKEIEGQRFVAAELDRLDSERIAGVLVRGLGTEHQLAERLPKDGARWPQLTAIAPVEPVREWRDLLDGLGYELERLPRRGWLAKHDGRPVIVIHPKASASEFARLGEDSRLPEGALLAACDEHGADYGILAAGSRLRLLRAAKEEAGQSTRYLELDSALIEPERRPLLGLLSPKYLAEGELRRLLADARDYGVGLRKRLDRKLRQEVLPILGRELGSWAAEDGRDLSDDEVRTEIERAVLTFIFRALFLLYAESAGYLPMANQTYRRRSMTRIAQRASEELESADPKSTSLWRDIGGLIEAMRDGQSAWGVPAYNGSLFAAHGFDGTGLLERASIPDAALAPALVALAREPDEEGNDVGVDFSGLEIGHLGHIYEGLLSLRLSVADRDFDYDERSDRYVPDDQDGHIDISAGELFWQTNEGGRKGGGVYYTRTELVRHLVRGSVRPAFREHVAKVRELAKDDPAKAGAELFEFYVLDPACGSAHFLVEVVEEIADQIVGLLGEVALPAVRDQLRGLRGTAGATAGIEVDDTALLKRLVLKRCVYGVDLSPMGAEIAKVSLWLATFVPGLSLTYLDRNIREGNSLIGVSRPEVVMPESTGGGTEELIVDPIAQAVSDAAAAASELRQINDRTPDEVQASVAAGAKFAEKVEGARRVFDLWTAEPLGLKGARHEARERAEAITSGKASPLAEQAVEICRQHRALHWPLEFPEVFAKEDPGFDVVVGNPPWDEVNVDELNFYSLYRPGLRSMADDARVKETTRLLEERPELKDRLEEERAQLRELRAYLSPEGGYVPGPGNADLYEFFCQRYEDLLSRGGYLGVVLPRSVLAAKGSASFREWMFNEMTPERIDVILNRARWAFDMEARYTIALVVARRGDAEPREGGPAVEVAGVASSAEEFEQQRLSAGITVDTKSMGPGLEIPLLPSQGHADALANLRSGTPFAFGSGRWTCFPVQGDFNQTADKALWEGADLGWRLWKGGSFDIFDPNGADERWCEPGEEALKKARKPRPGSGSILADEVDVATRREAVERTVGKARVAFRDVTRATDSRTVRACLVPPETFLLNSAPYLAMVEVGHSEQAAVLALMSSLPFDWQARRYVETHLNFFVLESLRLPTLDDETFDALAVASARLSCVDERFAEFAEAVGVEYGPLADDEKTALRVDIDARVAHAWELTADELDLVFTDFTLDAVPEDYREAVRNRFAELT